MTDKDDKQTDSKGRARRPQQDAALNKLNEARAHGPGVEVVTVRVVASPDAAAWFRGLTTTQRGAIVEAAHNAENGVDNETDD
ncbi:MAG: hypothetical protein U5L04_09780 [Trueperaceae bacterium]|nr:hypothetical protein [Trueperaceae bacterium]